ncbi:MULTISPECIES: carbonic anhydrase [Tenebrionibacter/Tenebrionicola group]|jgi:carbonic anhydrase|uniref:Carbonic anhydrase n=2 Tax=Tenebrionibacter/Tenebrionicola group TaxID=2969848 RepID=A0A8K0V490_9ENTR|nr:MULTISPECIES: carbonic anhydrase family protein [Tenebrionibacter/Tenebrionicola group]MBK4715386.1 carbonic anhydrase family protein [Tenebrionibacter intestinalis]MBV5094483.1 carbonic anhydrase family protein [Tenebrionicola larvae]
MAKKFNGIMLALALLPAIASASEWGYEGDTSPENWAGLNKDWEQCQKGRNQSPVDIRHTYKAHIRPLKSFYSSGPDYLLNNGHTIQATWSDDDKASYIKLDDEKFTLRQFHFHAPSENTVNGKHYPLEMHLVHQDDEGEMAVVAVMFNVGASNAELEKLWKVMPDEADKGSPLRVEFDVNNLLPTNKTHWRYTGSLTTPPCTEGVRWVVMKHPLTISADQLKKFKAVMHHPNNRPVQKLHGRMILD